MANKFLACLECSKSRWTGVDGNYGEMVEFVGALPHSFTIHGAGTIWNSFLTVHHTLHEIDSDFSCFHLAIFSGKLLNSFWIAISSYIQI